MGKLATVAAAIGCGGLAGLLYLAVTVGTPGAVVLVYMTQLPLFVAGLWFGTGAVVLAGVTGIVVLVAASDLVAAAIFAAVNAAPVAVLVRQALLARRGEDGTLAWYPPGLLTAWLTAFALGGFAVALIVFGGPQGLQSALRTLVGHAFDRMTPRAVPNREHIIESLVAIIPGIVAVSWMITSVGNAALAQGLLVRFGANWRPSPRIAELGLPLWIPIVLGLAAAASVFEGGPRFVGINAMIALGVPFCLAGLAVVHAAAHRMTYPGMALGLFYALAVLFGWPFLVVAGLGLLECWLGLRHRLAADGVD